MQTQVQQTPNNQQINQNLSNQTKIMNAVASAVACPPVKPNKIRRRPENKVSFIRTIFFYLRVNLKKKYLIELFF